MNNPLTREWLETNGIGGFASSTVSGMNTRRYHGLLVAATKPPVGRMVLLSKFEETLIAGDRRIELSSNRYPGAIHPQGHLHLKDFRRHPFPAFVYEVAGIEIVKSIFMVHGENTTVIEYTVNSSLPCRLELRPLIAFRDYHSTTHQNEALDPTLHIQPGCVTCSPYQGLPPLSLSHTPAEIHPTGDWYRNFEYAIEEQRGLDCREDLFQPLSLTFDLQQTPHVTVIAATGPRSVDAVERLRSAEVSRRAQVLTAAPSDDLLAKSLAQAASQFIVRRGEDSTVIAGYHWFSDWGRDTMIALPGLTLATGRHDDARGILLAFAAAADRGMLPNRFPDAGELPEYNTVDATLWFFEAVRAFAAHTGDYEFVSSRLYGVLADIVAWHERGTRYGIRMDSDGLLLAGEPGVQLTWMDAKVGDWVVTPRHGKPVEIQALWYNALRVLEDFALRFGEGSSAAHYRDIAARARDHFAPQFWNESAGCLYDVVSGESRDASIRPNQIFAVSLFHKMLTPEQSKSVVAIVREHLLTPYGLRSLAPADPQYRGRYEGNPSNRDSAYHQGTVWPWLLGPFLTAWVEVNGRSPEARRQAAEWLGELHAYLESEGQVPEVFDGDSPHRPGGCMAQAWSVAELLRALVEVINLAAPLRTAAAGGSVGM